MEREDAKNASKHSIEKQHNEEDDSITTSTESESFESWTLVTDKQRKRAAAAQQQQPQKNQPTTTTTNTTKNRNLNANNRTEILERLDEISQGEDKTEGEEEEGNDENEEVENQKKPKPDLDSTNDELSDGISIISESESGGRVSPHPYLLDHLSNLNMKYVRGDIDDICTLPPLISHKIKPTPLPQNELITDDNEDNTISEVRQRRRKRSSNSAEKEKSLISTETTDSDNAATGLSPIMKHGLTGFFYLAVTIVILAFISKCRYPEWDPLNKPVAELQQKFIEMEMQNNLLRAEMDILTKQVYYLNDKIDNENGAGRGAKDEKRKGKTYKVWPSIDEILEPVDLTKLERKLPFKCEDGRLVEIAAMCLEKGEPLNDEMLNAADEALQQSETFKSFEKVVETLNVFNTQPPFTPLDAGPTTSDDDEDFGINKNDDNKVNDYGDDDKVEDDNNKVDEGLIKSGVVYTYDDLKNIPGIRVHKPKGRFPNFKEQVRKFKEHFSKEAFDKSKERFDKSKERFEKSKEQFDKIKQRFDNSKEHENKYGKFDKSQENDNSKERFNKQRKGKFNSGEQQQRQFRKNENGGDWHEKLMAHREHARHENSDERNDKNWYIQRSGSREQMRVR